MMLMDQWFLIGVALFGLTTLIHLAALWRPEGVLSKISLRSLEGAIAFWGLLLVCWCLRFSSEGINRLLLGLSALGVAGLFRLSLTRYALHRAGSVVSALATLLATSSFMFSRPLSLHPDTSRWLLIIHIGLAMIGLIAFALTAVMSGLYLIQERRLKSKKISPTRGGRLPSLFVLDELCLKGLLIGFPFYTVALLLGSAQAFRSQGELHFSYIVAFMSWLIFGGVLQARLTAGWRGRRAALLTLIAFSGVLIVVLQYNLRVTSTLLP